MGTEWRLTGLVKICKIVSYTIIALAIIDGVFDQSSGFSFEVWGLKAKYKTERNHQD